MFPFEMSFPISHQDTVVHIVCDIPAAKKNIAVNFNYFKISNEIPYNAITYELIDTVPNRDNNLSRPTSLPCFKTKKCDLNSSRQEFELS